MTLTLYYIVFVFCTIFPMWDKKNKLKKVQSSIFFFIILCGVVSTSAMGLGRIQSVSFFANEGVGPRFSWACFIVWFHHLQLPLKFLLVLKREIWPNSGEIHIAVQLTEQKMVGSGTIGHSTKKILFGPLLQNSDGDRSFGFMG